MSRTVFNRCMNGLMALPILGSVAGCANISHESTGDVATTMIRVTRPSFGPFVRASLTTTPIGAYEFCEENKRECGKNSRYHNRQSYKTMSSDTWAAVHHQTMTTIKPLLDIDNYGIDEIWTYPKNGRADCEDFQLHNRREAMDRYKLSPNDSIFIIVRQANNEGHIVQAVNTNDKGWMVSDNLVPNRIYALNDVYNRYPVVVKITNNLKDWYNIQKIDVPIVATIAP